MATPCCQELQDTKLTRLVGQQFVATICMKTSKYIINEGNSFNAKKIGKITFILQAQ